MRNDRVNRVLVKHAFQSIEAIVKYAKTIVEVVMDGDKDAQIAAPRSFQGEDITWVADLVSIAKGARGGRRTWRSELIEHAGKLHGMDEVED